MAPAAMRTGVGGVRSVASMVSGRRTPGPAAGPGPARDTGTAGGGPGTAATGGETARAHAASQPAWAKRLHRRQQISHAATTAAHTLRSGDGDGDGGGAGSGPSLRDEES